MQITGLAKKVTIYIDESDKWEHKPLHLAILETLRKEDCAGATVTRALAGFGAHSRIHSASLVALSADLPLVIEWVDSPEHVGRVLPSIQAMVTEGLIIVQEVEIISYRRRPTVDEGS
jgi:PII-like signaling protein